MRSDFLRLNVRDFVRGLVVAVLAAIISWAAGVFQPGVDFATIDWSAIWQIAITSGVAYVAKNLLSDDQGLFLGKIG